MMQSRRIDPLLRRAQEKEDAVARDLAERQRAHELQESRLAELRRSRPELTHPGPGGRDAEVLPTASGNRYMLQRGGARVVMNLSSEPWDVPGGDVWIASTDPGREGDRLVVAPDSAVVIGE